MLLPSVSAHIFDESGRLLLVRQRDGDVWSTPGGSIELDERPADAVLRETWEETGLLVEPVSVAGVYGGRDFIVRYPNGDETQYVIIAFECRITGGSLSAESDEMSQTGYFSYDEAAALRLSSWLRGILAAVYSRRTAFENSTWQPEE